ncbi:MAG: peptidoglycan/LPS O-acetylase OafA/YrhL [Glaciecola sp.]|jgi:peptidoglycan/LPS O-acetylase OafA/YrhL
MTGIIFRGLEQEHFSILKFYVARANRIIPPLAMLCLVLLIFGWFYLTPPDYKILGEHVGSSIGFFSNITYWKESGYFDASSHEKWLLHTWSLSVEWQFYVIYPLVLVILRRLMVVKSIKKVILMATVLGFIFCVVVSYKWPNSAYYLLPTRAWEMMVGGLAFLYPLSIREANKKFLAWGGLTLIIGSCFLVSEENAWPGYLGLLPVLGTFFVIQAQQNSNLLVGNIVFQKLGAWSYSIYLWHWPLVVAIYYFSLNEDFTYLGIIVSVFLGFVSHKYIEKISFRNDFKGFISYMNCKPIYITCVLISLGSLTALSNGVNQRFTLDSEYKAILKETLMPLRSNGYCFYSFKDGYTNVDKEIGTNCYLGAKKERTSTLLFGDSFAGHNEPFLDEVFKANNASFQSIVTNWCSPSLTDRFTGPKYNLS